MGLDFMRPYTLIGQIGNSGKPDIVIQDGIKYYRDGRLVEGQKDAPVKEPQVKKETVADTPKVADDKVEISESEEMPKSRRTGQKAGK